MPHHLKVVGFVAVAWVLLMFGAVVGLAFGCAAEPWRYADCDNRERPCIHLPEDY